MQIVVVDNTNRDLVQEFLSTAGTTLETFRYFNKRNLNCLDNHLLTCIVMDSEGNINGYSHLDRENDVVWLGIAIVQGKTRKGIGKALIAFVLNEARKKHISRIKLSVDSRNLAARSLYEKFNFKIIEEINDICFYERIT
ncbi:MAG: GNAT family N-acetyltransferase [Ginsengibacter sp.]